MTIYATSQSKKIESIGKENRTASFLHLLPITVYCATTFPSRDTANPRRPLRVMPLIYKWDRLSEINMCGDGYKDFTRFSIVVSRSPFGSRFHRPNVCGGKICVWIPPDVIYIKDFPFHGLYGGKGRQMPFSFFSIMFELL